MCFTNNGERLFKMKLNRMLPVLFGIGILGAGAPKLSVKSDDLKNRIFEITRTINPIIIDGDFDDPGFFLSIFKISNSPPNFPFY